jgi:hypothetical protein
LGAGLAYSAPVSLALCIFSAMNVRPANNDDVNDLASMNLQLIRAEGHRNPMGVTELFERMSSWLNSEYRAAIIEDGVKSIGYALWREEEEYLYIRQFYIEPGCRRKGLGARSISLLKSGYWQGRRLRLDMFLMKTKYLLIIPILLIASIANAFEFFSTNRAATYTLETVSDQLSKEYKTPYRVYSALVAANSTVNTSYKNQFSQLAALDAESLSLIYISATANEEVISGYHTTTPVAQSILNGSTFQVAVYSPEGTLIVQSGSVLLANQIAVLVTEHSQALKAQSSAAGMPQSGAP